MVRRIVAATFLLGVLSTGAAQARGEPNSITDRAARHHDQSVSVMAYVPWYHGFGFGVVGRYEIPVVPDGFIPALNDSFSIEPSLGLAYLSWGPTGYSYNVFEITPAAYGIWRFYFTDKFDAYGGLGLGFAIGNVSGNNAGTFNASYFYWDPVVGLHFKISRNVALRAESGAQGLKGGVTFIF